MTTPLVKIVLHGRLAEVTGRRVWFLAVRSVSEAIRAIEANCRRFYHFLREERGGLVPYRVLTNGRDHKCIEELSLPQNLRQIDLIPDPEGAGGEWQVVIGALLIIVGALLAPYTGGSSSALVKYGVGLLVTAGVALLVGGISQMIYGSPATDLSKQDRPDRKPSNDYSGVINAVQQGNPVPVGYGTMLIGSQVISAGLEAQNVNLS